MTDARLLRRVLSRHAGAAVDATAVAAAASRAYDDLAQVLAPVIGDVGVAVMTDRALHLAAREYPWLPSSEPGAADTSFTKVIDALKRLDDPAVAADGAAAVFEAILGLLATFIGEPLAARLVQQAWPEAASSADRYEGLLTGRPEAIG
jgi:hypothetical protein